MYIRLKIFVLSGLMLLSVAGVWAQAGRVTATGWVRQIIFESADTPYEYVLDTDSHESYRLAAPGDLAQYANRRVTATGTVKDETLRVDGKITDIGHPEVTIPPPTFGSRKLLFILVNFTNDQSQPMTHAQTRAGLFGDPDSVDKLYRSASFHRYDLTGIRNPDGDVVGWVTIPFTNENCQSLMFTQWTSAADNAARALSVEPTNYNSVLYIFAPPPLCSLTYYGTVGDPGGQLMQRSWYQAKMGDFPLLSKAVAHELGHNLGLEHASAYRCAGPNIPADCQRTEYGDPACLMSAARDASLQFPNNYYMLRLGWLAPWKIKTMAERGAYTVTLHSPASWVKGVKGVQIPLKDANGQLSGKSYFLEARRNMPFDEMYPEIRPFAAGVAIRFAPDDIGARGSQSYLIDTTPGTPSFDDAPLAVGRTYSDTARGVSITTLSAHPIFGTKVRIEINR